MLRQIERMQLAAAGTGLRVLPGLEWIGHGYRISGAWADCEYVNPAPIYTFDSSLLSKTTTPLDREHFLNLPFVDAISCPKVDYEESIIHCRTVRELQETYGLKASIDAGFWFSGEASLGRTEEQLWDTSYSYAAASLRVVRWSLQVQIPKLKPHLHPDFKAALAAVQASIPSGYRTGSPSFGSPVPAVESLFGTYGAYFVTGILVGGAVRSRSVVDNYVYVDQQNSSVDVAASFLSAIHFDGSYSSSSTTGQYRDAEASSISAIAGDRDLAVRLLAPNATVDDYQAWVASVEGHEAMIDFVDASPGSNVPLAGIWLLADNDRQASFIKEYFTTFYAPVHGISIDSTGSFRRKIPYTMTVKTCDVDYAGTDSVITVELKGDRSVVGPDQTFTLFGHTYTIPGTDLTSIVLPSSADRYEKGARDDLKAPVDFPAIYDLGDITRMRVCHDNSGDYPGWKVEWIEIGYGNKTWRFGHNIWLADDEGGRSKDLNRMGD